MEKLSPFCFFSFIETSGLYRKWVLHLTANAFGGKGDMVEWVCVEKRGWRDWPGLRGPVGQRPDQHSCDLDCGFVPCCAVRALWALVLLLFFLFSARLSITTDTEGSLTATVDLCGARANLWKSRQCRLRSRSCLLLPKARVRRKWKFSEWIPLTHRLKLIRSLRFFFFF